MTICLHPTTHRGEQAVLCLLCISGAHTIPSACSAGSSRQIPCFFMGKGVPISSRYSLSHPLGWPRRFHQKLSPPVIWQLPVTYHRFQEAAGPITKCIVLSQRIVSIKFLWESAVPRAKHVVIEPAPTSYFYKGRILFCILVCAIPVADTIKRFLKYWAKDYAAPGSKDLVLDNDFIC